ncbi:immunoglobulin-like and fibronectin type III domain-containing protein 1 isoform X2 [Denticeps clupeoides]|uniref:immunoglobulin-like and fibronectin type III domain-containing protein 1 isoform X2 n=1 Tax=Denticeps clupeoides TaxID=299321 RepID=UPI0010A2C2E7|nr:immunoglobulin-like and fibronectin type III domain-containing protein 1 isoform X2 [Denticeps clupeoides]
MMKAIIADHTATGQGVEPAEPHKKRVGFKKRSKIPGVMVTQWMEELPEGKSNPDFLRKPIALTIQEGRTAAFKAVVSGEPRPEVSWRRARGDMNNTDKFRNKYDESTGEYTLEILKVTTDEADTYKCYAHNEFGKAVCTATLNVIEVGFKKKKAMEEADMATTDPAEFRKMLRKRAGRAKPQEKKEGDVDESFWEIMTSAEKKDYERICTEFGVTDYRWMLKKLGEFKKEQEEEQKLYVEAISNLRHIEVKGDGTASFELDLELKDPCSRIFLYKDGVMIPYSENMEMKHNLKKVGKKLVFTVKDLLPEDAGLYQVDVEEVNVFSTEFKIPSVNFIVKIQEVKAKEREDALFECVLSMPLPKIVWIGKNATLEDGDKYSITVSEDKLIHRLLVKDCMQLDKGIYTAIAGIKSCSAWLVIEADSGPPIPYKKKSRKTTQAGGSGLNVEKLAQEQQLKLQMGNGEKNGAKTQDKAKQQKMAMVNGNAEHGEGHGFDNSRSRLDCGGSGGLDRKGQDGHDSGGADLNDIGIKGTGNSNDALSDSGAEYTDSSGRVLPNKDPNVGTSQNSDDPNNNLLNNHQQDPNKEKECLIGNSKNDINQNGLGGHKDDGDAANRIYHGNERMTSDKETAGNPEASTTNTGKNQNALKGRDAQNGQDATNQHKSAKIGGHSVMNGEDDQHASNEQDAQCTKDVQKIKSTHYAQNEQEGLNRHTGISGENNGPSDRQSDRQAESLDNIIGHLKSFGEHELHGKDKNAENTGQDPSDSDENKDRTKRRLRQAPLLPEAVADPGVQFVSGLSNVNVIIGQPAELTCKVSSDQCDGTWYKDGKKLATGEGIIISKDGACHKLTIKNCQADNSGKYRFEADGRKSESILHVEDPPRLNPGDLDKFSEPVVVKAGQNAIFKMPFVGQEPMKIQWYRDGEELIEENNVKIEKFSTHSRLILSKCQRKQTGEIKIKIKNDHGTVEAYSKIVVLDKPGPPQGPIEVGESSATCIEFKWRPPKDDGGSPVKNYILERQQIGRNTWKKIGEVSSVPHYRDTDVDHGRKYCYRIQAVTDEGVSEIMMTEDVMAGTLAFPGPPAAPKVVSACSDCINVAWTAPSNTGGSRIMGYNLEKRKKGSSLWSAVNPPEEPIKEKKYAVKDLVSGTEYEFRVTAINVSGAGEASPPSEFVFARDPKKPPGNVSDLKVTDTTYNTVSLAWAKPSQEVGVQDEAKGYFVEIRPAESIEWIRCNAHPITLTSFTIKGLKTMSMYWVRVIATNDGGNGAPTDVDNYVVAMPPPVRPRFTDQKMNSFMVVRAGNSLRIRVNFAASPWPEVDWLKDGVPVSKRATISTSDGTSQLLIPSSERTDTGVYTVVVKNMVGQETFSVEVRVTDEPKPPGPIALEENVPGTVTVIWESSPDEKRDDRLHYMVSQRDSTKQTWSTVGDRLFNNKFTACNIMPGREYHFRVYAKNDMGMSEPSESPTWGSSRKRDKFVIKMPIYKEYNLQCAPSFLVPLKLHTAPKGYECYMTCAVKGNPVPRITWYRNSISLNTNTNYYITNTCGVCSMLILRVGPKDEGEYTIRAESSLGRAECSTTLTLKE